MNGQEKFDTCRFRSIAPYDLEIRGCGICPQQNANISYKKAYSCMNVHILLDDVSASICQVCDFYKGRASSPPETPLL